MLADKSFLAKPFNLDFISSISLTITPRNLCCVTSPSLSVSATVSLSLSTSKPMVAVNTVYYNRAHALLQECEWKWLANRSISYILLNHKVMKWDTSLYACRCVRECTRHLSLLPEMGEWVVILHTRRNNESAKTISSTCNQNMVLFTKIHSLSSYLFNFVGAFSFTRQFSWLRVRDD